MKRYVRLYLTLKESDLVEEMLEYLENKKGTNL